MLKRRAKPIDETFFADEMGITLLDDTSPEGRITHIKRWRNYTQRASRIYLHDNLKLQGSWIFSWKNGFDIDEFPRFPPVFSPIESLWKSLKDRVRNENPKTELLLVKSLKNWEVLTESENLNLYFEMVQVFLFDFFASMNIHNLWIQP